MQQDLSHSVVLSKVGTAIGGEQSSRLDISMYIANKDISDNNISSISGSGIKRPSPWKSYAMYKHVEDENASLHARLTSIAEAPSQTLSAATHQEQEQKRELQGSQKVLRRVRIRQQEAARITQENKCLFLRLQATKPFVDTAEQMQQSYQKASQISRRISRRNLHSTSMTIQNTSISQIPSQNTQQPLQQQQLLLNNNLFFDSKQQQQQHKIQKQEQQQVDYPNQEEHSKLQPQQYQLQHQQQQSHHPQCQQQQAQYGNLLNNKSDETFAFSNSQAMNTLLYNQKVYPFSRIPTPGYTILEEIRNSHHSDSISQSKQQYQQQQSQPHKHMQHTSNQLQQVPKQVALIQHEQFQPKQNQQFQLQQQQQQQSQAKESFPKYLNPHHRSRSSNISIRRSKTEQDDDALPTINLSDLKPAPKTSIGQVRCSAAALSISQFAPPIGVSGDSSASLTQSRLGGLPRLAQKSFEVSNNIPHNSNLPQLSSLHSLPLSYQQSTHVIHNNTNIMLQQQQQLTSLQQHSFHQQQPQQLEKQKASKPPLCAATVGVTQNIAASKPPLASQSQSRLANLLLSNNTSSQPKQLLVQQPQQQLDLQPAHSQNIILPNSQELLPTHSDLRPPKQQQKHHLQTYKPRYTCIAQDENQSMIPKYNSHYKKPESNLPLEPLVDCSSSYQQQRNSQHNDSSNNNNNNNNNHQFLDLLHKPTNSTLVWLVGDRYALPRSQQEQFSSSKKQQQLSTSSLSNSQQPSQIYQTYNETSIFNHSSHENNPNDKNNKYNNNTNGSRYQHQLSSISKSASLLFR